MYGADGERIEYVEVYEISEYAAPLDGRSPSAVVLVLAVGRDVSAGPEDIPVPDSKNLHNPAKLLAGSAVYTECGEDFYFRAVLSLSEGWLGWSEAKPRFAESSGHRLARPRPPVSRGRQTWDC